MGMKDMASRRAVSKGAVCPNNVSKGAVCPSNEREGAVCPNNKREGAVCPRNDEREGAVCPSSSKGGAVCPPSSEGGAVCPPNSSEGGAVCPPDKSKNVSHGMYCVTCNIEDDCRLQFSSCVNCPSCNLDMDLDLNIESRFELMKQQTNDWFELKRCMETHKSAFPAFNTQLKSRTRWENIKGTAENVRKQFTSMAVNDQWRSRQHIRQLLPFIINASKTCDGQPVEVWQNKPVIYARFNLENKDLYIGQTTNWNERFEKHTREVMKHYKGLCKGCGMHHTYTKQAKIHPAQWMMIPIDFPTVLDLDRQEKQMIYRMRSNLNKEIYGGHKQIIF